jgi:O-antigen ligase/tetratricopeptide (TPR) repeat protein
MSVSTHKDILKWIIFAGLFLVPFVPFFQPASFFFPFITAKAFAWRIIIQIVFAAWLILVISYEEYRPKRSIAFYAVLAFLAVIGIADLFGVMPIKSFWSNFERMEGYIALLHLGMFFLVIGSLFREEHWKRWWNTSLIASVIMGIIALSEVYLKGEIRVDATFGNPIYLAVYALFHIFIAVFFLYREWLSKTLRIVYSFFLFLNIIVLYYTATRGAILGFIGGFTLLAILGLFNREHAWARKVGILTLVGFVVLILSFWVVKDASFIKESPVLSRFSSLNMEDIRGQGRYFVWPMAIEGFKDRPILGWGQENFNYVFQEYYKSEMFRLEPWFDRVHNIFLDWMVAGGVLGLSSYLFLYIALIILIIKDQNFSKIEKAILYGLIFAYFIHNFFVFDHLISYILFFSLLAYLHSRSSVPVLVSKKISQGTVNVIMPFILVALIFSLYFTNLKPIWANTELLSAIYHLQLNPIDVETVVAKFESAYKQSRLGRPEIVEQISFNSPAILSLNDVPIELRNRFFEFARGAVEKQAEDFVDDSRYQLVTGTFLSYTTSSNDALVYLERARELIPNKQQVYFEIGSSLINAKRVAEALEVFRYAYELAPEYRNAQEIYLLGAIYAGDRTLEAKLLEEIGDGFNVKRIASAYTNVGRLIESSMILEKQIEISPRDLDLYIMLITSYLKAGRQNDAINVLEKLKLGIPEYKTTAEEYIRQIRSGELAL